MKEKESLLTFLQDLGVNEFNQMTSLYRCDCGKWKVALRYMVQSGKTKSCGCLRKNNHHKTHNLRNHPLYGVWGAMKSRCLNKNSSVYNRYGGAGVTICDEWKNSFESFYNWAISNGWEQGKQIDKDIIPKKLGIKAVIYSPEMCTVATRIENSNNKWNHRVVEYNGEAMNCADICRKYKLDYGVFVERLDRGWSVKDAIEKELQVGTTYTYKGESMGVYNFAKKYGFSPAGLIKRLKAFNGDIVMAIETPKQTGKSLVKSKILNNNSQVAI